MNTYIGARYVPIFGRRGESSADWDNSAPYEPLTIVLYQGNSYTSRQYVPAGIAITNTDYWVLTGDYNSQIDAYRQEVLHYAEEVDAINDKLPATQFTSTNTVKNYVDGADTALSTRITTLERLYTTPIMVVIGDSFSYSQGGHSGTPYWHLYVAKALGVQVKNFASGSTGFLAPSSLNRNFATQISEAQADTSFDNNAVEYVIIYGGVNDGTDLNATTVFNTIVAAENAFPRANVFTFFNYSPANDNQFSIRRSIINSILTTHARIINTLWLCQRCVNFPSSDTLHPTEEGSRLIAGEMLSYITGRKFNILSDAINFSAQMLTSDVNYSAQIRGTPHVTSEGVELLVQLNMINTSSPTPYSGDITVLIPKVQDMTQQGGAADRSRTPCYAGGTNVANDATYYVIQGNDGLRVVFQMTNALYGVLRARVLIKGQ